MNDPMISKSVAGAALVCALIAAGPADAIDKCKVKVGKTGVIAVTAVGVSGTLRWGTGAGSETETFFNAGTCVSGTTAKGCQLADPATLAAKTPPNGCTLYLDDDGAPCSVWIRGCTPRSGETADFFALMPPDNAATVAPGAAVQFPQIGSPANSVIPLGPAAFVLPETGTYEVQFVVPVTEAGQLVVALNGVELANTVTGRATGTSLITGISLVTNTAPGTVLEIRNPSSSFSALTITPLSGGTMPASAHLVIRKL